MAIDTGKILFGLQNRATAATLTCAQEDSAFPVSNLLTDHMGDEFRSTGVGASAVIVIDLGAACDVDTIALFRHNLTTAATWAIEHSDNGSSWTSLLAATSVNAVSGWIRNHAIYLRTAGALSHRYWRLTISDAANPDAYHRASAIYVGAAWQPPINMQYGVRFWLQDGSAITEGDGGDRFVYVKGKARGIEFKVLRLARADVAMLRRYLDFDLGATGLALVMPFPDQPSYYHLENIWGSQEPQGDVHSRFQAWERDFRFLEAITGAEL